MHACICVRYFVLKKIKNKLNKNKKKIGYWGPRDKTKDLRGSGFRINTIKHIEVFFPFFRFLCFLLFNLPLATSLNP